ncbi:sulfotransferase family protein [Nitrospirillum sp. BR 11752]|uniref:sulfotransferase family protein n=1 Tax=Nitrospirillum sp. BR 11752 TaxID=3104293 RepID=UPI002EB3F763|nr:sulfotransferase family protein [Nitrospirillum sp. BR 11752]
MVAFYKKIIDLAALAELVEQDDAALDGICLSSDGRYQTREFPFAGLNDQVATHLRAGFRDRAEQDFPQLTCAWGRARVGSTALANLFGVAGLPSYYQPTKAIMRHVLAAGTPGPWVVPLADQAPHIFCKDVAGPYLTAECLYVPLRMLIEAGYPASRLHLVVLDRQPLHGLASWLRKWSHRMGREQLMENFVIASLNAVRVAAYARRQGVPVTHYVYEATRQPVPAAKALFSRVGLGDRFTPEMVTHWQRMDSLDGAGSSVIFPDEPDAYAAPGLHHQAGGVASYGYQDRDRGSVTDADLDLLHRFGVEEVYQRHAEACARDLDLPHALFRADGNPCAVATA